MKNYRTRIRSSINSDLPPLSKTSLTLASVLVPILTYEDEPRILLTQRAAHLAQHSGQVAFPGGKVEVCDTNPIATALREAEEEVGLPKTHVEVAGMLDHFETGTGFRILPVVGFVCPDFTPRADESEVAHIFEVPLHLALNANLYKEHSAFWRGKERRYHAFDYQGFHIWGATAGMLLDLSKRL